MAIKANPSFSLADQLFNRESVTQLADALADADPSFKKKKFIDAALKRFPDLGLKERISCLVDGLDDQLPAEFDAALAVLEAALPAPLDPTLTDDDFGQFIWAVPSEWVARHGCTEERVDQSLVFLKQATM